MLLQVILVVILRRIERHRRQKLSHNGLLVFFACGERVNDLLGGLALFLALIKDDRAVLGAKIVALAVELRGVVHPEKVT